MRHLICMALALVTVFYLAEQGMIYVDNHSIGELAILTVGADLRRCHLLWKGDGHPTACLILQGLPKNSERPIEILVLSADADKH